MNTIWIFLENSFVQISELSECIHSYANDSVFVLFFFGLTRPSDFKHKKKKKINFLILKKMSAIHAMSSNSNSPTDPLRHNLKVNGIIAQNNTKSNMVYSPLALANNTNVNNNNNHITNNNSNADNSSGWWFYYLKLYTKSVLKKKKKYLFEIWLLTIALKFDDQPMKFECFN